MLRPDYTNGQGSLENGTTPNQSFIRVFRFLPISVKRRLVAGVSKLSWEELMSRQVWALCCELFGTDDCHHSVMVATMGDGDRLSHEMNNCHQVDSQDCVDGIHRGSSGRGRITDGVHRDGDEQNFLQASDFGHTYSNQCISNTRRGGIKGPAL